ncbi:MAG: multidrug effflux MFS transporter [Rubrivivax sp.]|nr:multidrug effflux MFS transporter [Rubrivivax sp.]
MRDPGRHRSSLTATHDRDTQTQRTPTTDCMPFQRLLVANLLAQIAFGFLAMTISVPSMQEWGAILGADQASVQLTLSGFLVTYGALQLAYGPMSDRLGRKPVILGGLVLAFAGSVLAALAGDIAALIGARLLQGAGCAAGMVVGRAMVQDLFQGPQRTRVMAYLGMTMGLCPPAATIIGGQIHVRFGWQANFVLIAVLAAGLFLAAWRGLPAAQRREASGPQPHWLRSALSAYARLAREPVFLGYAAILGLTVATFYAFLGGAPLVLGSYGVGPEGIGFYVMCVPLSYICGNYLASHLVHRAGERRMMSLGQLLSVSGISLMLALALAGWQTALAFALPLTLLGLGHGLLVPPAMAGTVGHLPALAGAAAAVAGVTQQLMGAFGGYAVGWFSHHDAVDVGWLMLVFASCVGLALMYLRRRLDEASAAPEAASRG